MVFRGLLSSIKGIPPALHLLKTSEHPDVRNDSSSLRNLLVQLAWIQGSKSKPLSDQETVKRVTAAINPTRREEQNI